MKKKYRIYGLICAVFCLPSMAMIWGIISDAYGTMVNMQRGESFSQLIDILKSSDALASCIRLLFTAIIGLLVFVVLFISGDTESRRGLIFGGVCGLFGLLLIVSLFITFLAALSCLDGALMSFLRDWRIISLYILFAASVVLLWLLARRWA